jgi:hypothetical protein
MECVVTEDAALLRELREMWEALDPPPDDLCERILFTLELRNLEFELMQMRDAFDLVGARGPETARTVTFGSDSVTVMLNLSGTGPEPRRLDGWVVPTTPLRIELRTSTGTLETFADADGRFAFEHAPAGLVQLVLHPTEGTTVELTRPVITPAVQL